MIGVKMENIKIIRLMSQTRSFLISKVWFCLE